MKNIVKTFAATVMAAVMLIQHADAQTVQGSSSAGFAVGSSISAVDNITGEQKNNNALSGIHPRAVKDFQKSFKGITNEEWSKIDGGYIASFTQDSVQTRVDYNGRGARQHTILYYGEKKLPREVRNMVKSVYYDYTILNVVEIRLDDQPIYMVYMQDETHLKTIRVHDGEMQQVQNYIRG
ncbi:MAG TPA: hypothetical protein VH396_01910 [Chitinophagaceae bacterium]|jgi:hypothetical protein